MAGTSEPTRQLVHIGVGALALLLRWLEWPQAAAMAIAAIGFNRLILPSLSPSVFRDGDLEHPWTSGIVLYPMSVLALILLFRERLDLAAACWGILAAGDGAATLVGTTVRSPRLPWNQAKSLAGSLAFVVASTIAATALLAVVGSTPVTAGLVLIALLAASTAALVETIPIRLNDNISVPVAAAGVLLSTLAFSPSTFEARWPLMGEAMVAAIAVNAGVAVAGLLVATVTPAGAAVGGLIGVITVLGGGWQMWGLLIATFVAASLCTRVGRARKLAEGTAEVREGRRGPGNALANTGLAAWLCGVSTGVVDPILFHLAAAAALITAGSDTIASEIGKAYGKATWMVTTLARVPRGTTGAVSGAGTAAGVLSATALAAVAAVLGVIPWSAIGVVTMAATAASLIEGVVGATWEADGILNNDMVNLVNSAMGAGLTLLGWMWWS